MVSAADPLGRNLDFLDRTIEDLLERKSSGFGLENRDYSRTGSAALTTRYPTIHKDLY
jgi:hypothetical protein